MLIFVFVIKVLILPNILYKNTDPGPLKQQKFDKDNHDEKKLLSNDDIKFVGAVIVRADMGMLAC